MPTYELTSPKTGQSYRVQADGQLSPEDAESAVAHFDGVYERHTQNKPFFSVGDTLSGIGDAVSALPLTTLGAYHRMREGFKRPDQYDPEAQAVFDAEAQLNERMQRESQNRLMRGEASSTGDAFRAAAPSLGSTVGTMAAAVPAGMASGAAYGALAGTAVEPGGGTAVGGLGGAVVGGIGAGLAAGGAAYRMAGTQFLNDAFTRLEQVHREQGKPFTEEDRQKAYEALRPLAEDSALWEAGPEAVTNALTLGTAKLVFGLGKPLVKEIAKTTLGKLGIKAGAVAGDAVAEVAGETATSIGQAPLQAQAEAYAQGNPNWRQEQGPYAGPGGVMQAMRDVTPATLAMQALTLGAAGGVKAATFPFQRAQPTDAPAQTAPTPGLEEDLGDLTADDIADMQGTAGTPARPADTAPAPAADRSVRAPLVPSFRDDPLTTAPPATGDVITDLRIPRSPEAIAESNRIENERLAAAARLRNIDAKARGMPLIPDSPSGSRDILDFANENPIYLPPGFSEQRNLPEYEGLKEAKLPPYWRQFIASGKRGGNPSEVAQRAFDAGLIAEPTADAYFEALRGGISGRQQYRVQFKQREQALAAEEKRVVDFEKTQDKLARKRKEPATPVSFEDIVPGDQMTIDGEPAVVRNVEYNEDGYLTNVVIEDGKRFGLMQFDPQSRSGLLVDEFQPVPRRDVAADEFAPEDTGVGQGMSDPFATLMEGTESTRPRNRGETARPQTADPLAELGAATRAGAANQAQGRMGFTNLNTSGTTAGFLNTDILAEATALIQRGVTDFVAWSRGMIARFGEAIREFLGGVWQQVTNPQTNAAQNVRMGRPQGTAPVRLGSSGAVDIFNGRVRGMTTSAVEVLHQESADLPKPEAKVSNDEVAKKLQEAAIEQWGDIVTSDNITPEQEQILVANGVDEFMAAFRASGKTAADWYTTNIEAAMEVAKVLHPELQTDAAAQAVKVNGKPVFRGKQDAQLALYLAMAITSQNLNVNQNTTYAEEQFQIFKATGKFNPGRLYGEKAKSISANLDLANTILNELGWQSLHEIIGATYTVRELSGLVSKWTGKDLKIAGLMDDEVQGAAIFGPKIGQGFLQNLMGNYLPVTIDLWMRRTWGRWTGDVLGDGLTGDRIARLVDEVRRIGLALPASLSRVRPVVRLTEKGKPFRTMSEDFLDRVENEEDLRQEINDYAKEVVAVWGRKYKAVQSGITQAQVDGLLAGALDMDTVAAATLKSEDQLNRRWEAKTDKPKGKGAKEKWKSEQRVKSGRTQRLTTDQWNGTVNGVKNVGPKLKPQWALAANVIRTKLKPIDSPSDLDRKVISRIVNKIRVELEAQGIKVSNADIQAVLWYPEKDLWAKLRGEEESNLKQSYEDEFLQLARDRGLGAQAETAASRVRAARAGGSNDQVTDVGIRQGSGRAGKAQGFKNLTTNGRTAGFLNTDILAEATALIQRGVTDFIAWSRGMIARFGEAIREFLGGVWQQVTNPQTNAAQGRMDPLMSPANRLGRGLADLMPQRQGDRMTRGQGDTAAPLTRSSGPLVTPSLQSAYAQAARGSSSQMVPIRAVYEAARAQNPQLTVPQFLAEVQAADAAGQVLLEPFDSPASLTAAGEFTLRNSVGVPTVNMMVVPAEQGMTNAEGRMTNAGALQSPAAQQQDAAYLAAVQAGDMATAQRMVDEAAKAAGYDSARAFHGTASNFTQFMRDKLGQMTGAESAKRAFFFTDSKPTAATYARKAATFAEDQQLDKLLRDAEFAERRGNWDEYERLILAAENLEFGEGARERRQKLESESARVINVYLRGNYMKLDAAGNNYVNIDNAPDFDQFNGSLTAALEFARENNFEGVQIDNFDDAIDGTFTPATHWAVFDPNQIKSADPVTYDDAGNVIPLSQRFQTESPDIRFSPSTQAAIADNQARNEAALKALGLPTQKGTRIWGREKVAEALRRIARDDTQPATLRFMSRLLSRMPLGNLLLKIEADARLNYAGLYQPMAAGRGEISLNTRRMSRGEATGQGDVVESLVHEVLHHVTYNVLRNPKTAAQKQAKADLEALRKRALAALSAQEIGSQFDYELSNVDEFISALFTRADFQTALASIPLDAAPRTLGQRVRTMLDEVFRILAELVTGQKVEAGSVLEASFASTLRLIEMPGDTMTGRQGDGVTSGAPLKSYAGERAIENLPEERRQFMRDSLETARTMAAAGKTSEEIRAVTGWFPGKYDGKMRWEIPDEGARLNRVISKEFANNERASVKLGDWLDHPQLFEAYPDAADLKVEYDSELDSAGAFSENKNVIYFGDRATNLKSILLHEIQHWIQEKEGLARGSDPKQFESSIGLPRDIINLAVDIAQAAETYKMPVTQIRANPPRRFQSVPQEAWFLAENRSIKELLKEQEFSNRSLNPEDAYRRTAGEIEARDVQARQSLTPEQRRATEPYSSENIAKEDAIVMFGGTGAQALTQPPSTSPLASPAAPIPNETQSRFASPDPAGRTINGPRTDELVADEATAWLDSVDPQTAVELFHQRAVPLPLDAMEHAAALLLSRLSGQAVSGSSEVQRMWAHTQAQRMGRLWTREFLSADPARALRQRGVVNNTILAPIAPVLAAQEVLTDRAEAKIGPRFEGGTEGVTEKVKEILQQSELDISERVERILQAVMGPRLQPRVGIREAVAGLVNGRTQRQQMIDDVAKALMQRARTRQVTPGQQTALAALVASLKRTLGAAVRGEALKPEAVPMGELLARTFVDQVAEAPLFEQAWNAGRQQVLDMLMETGMTETDARTRLNQLMPATPTVAYAPGMVKQLVKRGFEQAGYGATLATGSNRTGTRTLDVRTEALRDPAKALYAVLKVWDDAAMEAGISPEAWQGGRQLAINALNETMGQWQQQQAEAEAKAAAATKASLLAKDSPALQKLLRNLREKIAPGMSWTDIFTELPATQKDRQREIYRRLMLDERLSSLTQDERLALTNELDKAWQRERREVFKRELRKVGVLGEKAKDDREKVAKATPRLLRLMNLGMLNSDLFREALAEEYGVRQITPAIAAELRALGERIQTAPEGLPRRKIEQQLVEKLQSLVDATLWQTIDSYWTASVLSGWRTQVDIGLSLANGIEDVGLGSVVTAIRTGNKDVAVRALGALFGRIPSAFMEAVDHIATGNKSMMRNFELEAKQAMEGGNRLASDVGAAMWKRGGWRKVPGGFMVFYGRLLTALDHINSASTREGALAMALARHPELYQKALRITPADRAAARKQARQELTLGTAPANRQQRLEEDARVREILEQGTPPELLDEALEVGRRAALQGEPTGIGGTLLDAVLSAVSVVNRKAEELAGRENADAITKQGAKVTGALVPFVRALTGTKFARTVAHAMNRNLSYVPGVGFYAVGQQGRTGAFADILMARQIIGTLVGIAAYLAFDDDEDEKGIEDGWKDKTPQQKAQLYAQGKQPFTVWGRDAQGRVVGYNYQQWGIAGILNTVAAMLKQKDSEAGTMNVLTNALIQGAMSFTDKAQLQGLQTVFGEQYRSTEPAAGIASNLNKWAAQTVGGIVPRIAKDIDNELSPELRDTSQWWQRWAKEVPVVRELSSGKRVNILGEDIKLNRGPLSRVRQVGTADPAYRTLGLLNSRDIYLPDPSTGVRIVRLADGTRRPMNPQEKDRYQRLTGAAYRELLNEKGPQLLQMDPEDAKDYILKTTRRLRDRAAVQAVK